MQSCQTPEHRADQVKATSPERSGLWSLRAAEEQCHCCVHLVVLSVHLEHIMHIVHLNKSGHLAISRQCLCHGQARSACEHANFQHCLGPCQSDQRLQKRPLQCASTTLFLLVELCLFLKWQMWPVSCGMKVQCSMYVLGMHRTTQFLQQGATEDAGVIALGQLIYKSECSNESAHCN